MEFSFGIITKGDNDEMLQKIIDSIKKQQIQDYEIIIVGNTKIKDDGIIIVPFDEKQKNNWITKKKNLITKYSTKENIVFMHDYIILCDGWKDGWNKITDSFSVCMNPIINYDNTRYRDWTLLCTHDIRNPMIPIPIEWNGLIPYTETRMSKWMYISGAYWVAKRSLMIKFPLDETKSWLESEDIIWCDTLLKNNISFSINPHSCVKLLKYKNPIYKELSLEKYEALCKFL